MEKRFKQRFCYQKEPHQFDHVIQEILSHLSEKEWLKIERVSQYFKNCVNRVFRRLKILNIRLLITFSNSRVQISISRNIINALTIKILSSKTDRPNRKTLKRTATNVSILKHFV